MAGQDDLDRGLGTGRDLQGVGMGLGSHRPVVADRGGGSGRDTPGSGGQGARLGFQQVEHPRQAVGVPAAGINVRPLDRPYDDGGLARCDMVEHDLVGRKNPHAAGP